MCFGNGDDHEAEKRKKVILVREKDIVDVGSSLYRWNMTIQNLECSSLLLPKDAFLSSLVTRNLVVWKVL